MTSFLALRASVVRIFLCLSPGNVLRVWVAEWTPPPDHLIYLAYFGRCTSEFEIASSRLALGVRPFFVTGDNRTQDPKDC